jgi:hypothetical protein
MPDINHALDWVQSHRALTVTAGVVLALAALTVIASQRWTSARERKLSARASIGFAVVQAGVAYVTITGVYGFWSHRLGASSIDAAGIAGIIEAVTWASVGMIFAHGAQEKSVGVGPAGNTFWSSVLGGGLMAVVGSPTIAAAIGRAAVVVIGANMWWLRIQMKTRRRPRTATKLLITPRQVMIRLGWLAADDTDVVQSPREWEVRRLTRAIRRKADGHGLTRWLGSRTIVRVMESGDAAMVRDAQGRFALQKILAEDLQPDSVSMKAAIEAARAVLYPPTPEPEVVAFAAVPEPVAVPEPAMRRPRPAPRPTVRAGPAANLRPDTVAATRKKADACDRAYDVLVNHGGLIDGKPITGKVLGAEFDMGEEWGRRCLTDARSRVALTTPVE